MERTNQGQHLLFDKHTNEVSLKRHHNSMNAEQPQVKGSRNLQPNSDSTSL